MKIMPGHVVRLPDGREGKVVKIISDSIVKVHIRKDGCTEIHPDDLENIGWVIPEWMENFRHILKHFTGGDTVEAVMNDHDSTIDVNAPRAMICVSVKSVVSILEDLHEDDKI